MEFAEIETWESLMSDENHDAAWWAAKARLQARLQAQAAHERHLDMIRAYDQIDACDDMLPKLDILSDIPQYRQRAADLRVVSLRAQETVRSCEYIELGERRMDRRRTC